MLLTKRTLYISLLLIILSSSAAMSILSKKNVLVTGGGRGIGRAIAVICAQEDANVAICSRTPDELQETLNHMKNFSKEGQFKMYTIDMRKDEQVEQMVSDVVKDFGSIDVLINNAGRNQSEKKKGYELSTSDLRDLLDLNLVSVHSITSQVLNQSMLLKDEDSNCRGGTIINISSKAGKIGIPNMAFYCASKFGLEGYSASLAHELKDCNVKVNTISPGMIDTVSFPKAPGRKGVRSAESVKDGLMLLLKTEKTGYYVHVDELDNVVEKGLNPESALKPIDETPFSV